MKEGYIQSSEQPVVTELTLTAAVESTAGAATTLRHERDRLHSVTITVLGHTVPVQYIATEHQTIKQPSGELVVRPIAPHFVGLAERARTPDDLDMARASAGRSRAMYFNTLASMETLVLDAPMAVSRNCAAGDFWLDTYTDEEGHTHILRIVCSESACEYYAVDADGDRGMMVWSKSGKLATRVKFPVTRQPPILRYRPGKLHEEFYSLTHSPTDLGDGWLEPGLDSYCETHPPYINSTLESGRTFTETFKATDSPEAPTLTTVNGITYQTNDEFRGFMKGHTELNVGLLTVTHNTWDIWTYATAAKNWVDRVKPMYRNDLRFGEIEGSLKSATKGHSTQVGVSALNFGMNLVPFRATSLTTAGSVTRLNHETSMWWAETPHTESLYRQVRSLGGIHKDEQSFVQSVSQSQERAPKPSQVADGQLIYRLLGFEYQQVPVKPVQWTEPDAHGRKRRVTAPTRVWPRHFQKRMSVSVFPHPSFTQYFSEDPLDFSKLPMCLFTLTHADGTPAALVDVKREDDRKEGMTYAFLVPPVWDAVVGWMHPVAKMARDFTTHIEQTEDGSWVPTADTLYDSRIVNPSNPGQKFSSLFLRYQDPSGRSRDDWARYGASKGVRLQATIAEWLGKYGFPIDGDWVDGQLVPSEAALKFVGQAATVDYGRDRSAEEMWDLTRRNIYLPSGELSSVQLNWPGNKQKNRRVRRYAIAQKNGNAKYAHLLADRRRPGCQLSQLTRTLNSATYRVAIVTADTKTQCHITPSGIQKQLTTRAFLPQTFNTEAEFQAYCTHLDPTAEMQSREFRSWATGETRVVYCADPKKSILVGKLIDTNGQKFMPRTIDQAWTVEIIPPRRNQKPVRMGKKTLLAEGAETASSTHERLQPIDLIIPMWELTTKGCHYAMFGTTDLRNVPLEWVEVPTDTGTKLIQCPVVEHTYYRTGSSSENIEPRYRVAQFKGLDSHIICYKVSQMHAADQAHYNADGSLDVVPQWGKEYCGDVLEALRMSSLNISQYYKFPVVEATPVNA